MSKELEALDRITEHLDLDDEYFYKGAKYDEKLIKEYILKSQEALKDEKENKQIIK